MKSVVSRSATSAQLREWGGIRPSVVRLIQRPILAPPRRGATDASLCFAVVARDRPAQPEDASTNPLAAPSLLTAVFVWLSRRPPNRILRRGPFALDGLVFPVGVELLGGIEIVQTRLPLALGALASCLVA